MAEKENKTLEIELRVARKKIDEQEEEIAELYLLQDKLDQYTRKQSLEICGIPDSAYSSAEEAVLKLAETLDVPLTLGDKHLSGPLHMSPVNRAGSVSEISPRQSFLRKNFDVFR